MVRTETLIVPLELPSNVPFHVLIDAAEAGTQNVFVKVNGQHIDDEDNVTKAGDRIDVDFFSDADDEQANAVMAAVVKAALVAACASATADTNDLIARSEPAYGDTRGLIPILLFSFAAAVLAVLAGALCKAYGV